MISEKMFLDRNGKAHQIVVQPLYGIDDAFTVIHYIHTDGTWNLRSVAGCSDESMAMETVNRILDRLQVNVNTLH